MSKKLTPTIGLEIHIELATNSKMFCGCSAHHFGIKPNTHTCPVCLGLPGALPVPNKKAVDWTILAGLALNCSINHNSKFDRKHYFYPDLPKGYQISQYDEPFCEKGFFDTSEGRVGITRVHLEEDTGKLIHKKVKGKEVTLVDFNRSGVPLMEIVTEPDIHSASQTRDFSQSLRRIIRYLGISDCDMEKGSMRLEANVSWGVDLGYKVEVKNLNSFKFVEKAVKYELQRQKKLLSEGVTPSQETRGWSEKTNKTVSQRVKETSADYRYFPEPDIPPMKFRKEEVEKLKKTLPELPFEKANRFRKEYKLSDQYLKVLTEDRKKSEKVEEVFEIAAREGIEINLLAGEIVNKKVNFAKITPSKLVGKLKKQKSAKIVDEKQIKMWVKGAIKTSPQAVVDYQKGKTTAISALIGKVMQLSKGRADPFFVRKNLTKRLGSKKK